MLSLLPLYDRPGGGQRRQGLLRPRADAVLVGAVLLWPWPATWRGYALVAKHHAWSYAEMIPTPNIPLVDERARAMAWDQCALFPGIYEG